MRQVSLVVSLTVVIVAACCFADAATDPVKAMRLPLTETYAALGELREVEIAGNMVKLGWTNKGIFGMMAGNYRQVFGEMVQPGESKGSFFLPFTALGLSDEPRPNAILEFAWGTVKFIFPELNREMPELSLECGNADGWEIKLVSEHKEGERTGFYRVIGNRADAAHMPKFKVRWVLPHVDMPYLWSPSGCRGVAPDWDEGTTSNGMNNMPLNALVGMDGGNWLAWGTRAPRGTVRHGAGVHKETAEIHGFFAFHECDETTADHFEKVLRFDWRKVPYYEAVAEMSAWIRGDPACSLRYDLQQCADASGRCANVRRVGNCPGNADANRQGIMHLRLTSGDVAVHSDMLKWHVKEPAQTAARHILSAIFGVVELSMQPKNLPKDHRRMISNWLQFSLEHRDTLLKSRLMPLYPELNYAVIGAESANERIWGVYNQAVACAVGAPDRKVIVMNGTGLDGITLELPVAPAKAVVRDCFGEIAFYPELRLGARFVTVPSGGSIELEWRAPVARYSDYDGTLIDNCWMWGHDSGVYDGTNNPYGIPLSEPVTMVDAIKYMGIPNVCVVRWGDAPAKFKPQPPLTAYLASFAGVKRFTWAIANNKDPVYAQMKRFVPGLLDKAPNMIGFDLDDFFRAHLEPSYIRTDNGIELAQPGALSYEELKELKAIMRAYSRPLDMRMTIYVKDLKPEIVPLARFADSVALWTWSGGEIVELEKNFAKYRSLVPDTPTLLGIYMWDFGGMKPLDVSQMEYQLMKALELFKVDQIDGLIFHCTPLVNKNLAAVEYCKKWLGKYGKTRKEVVSDI